jgi:hypothetical protein
MPLKFNGAWRFIPPGDGRFINQSVPDRAVAEFIDLIMKVSTQGDRQSAIEHFKGYFCTSAGVPHSWSTSDSWAMTDLWTYAGQAASNAPLFIEAFYDACQTFRGNDEEAFAPDVEMINSILVKHDIGYAIRPPRLELREDSVPIVAVAEAPPTLAERAVEILHNSLNRSEELLAQNRSREAVQECLWLLETVVTAFRGRETQNEKVEGKYFNQIVKELRRANAGTSLERILDWMTALHGYLSSPTGGGVRHGLDLNEGVPIGDNDARLFCNLIRSYLSFLLVEHERLGRCR